LFCAVLELWITPLISSLSDFSWHSPLPQYSTCLS
jgi:hypothetical protein